MEEQSDYLKYRGKCKEYVDAAVLADPTLKAVRGWYFDFMWGEQQHWWCVKPDGTIVDPTAKQFPSKGSGDYVEFDGVFSCEQCGEKVKEEDATVDGHHIFCSGDCYARCVGF